jgi:hypothetical protein
MTDNAGWFTTQFRVRRATHAYLAAQAANAGISITQAAGAILDAACRQGVTVGPAVVIPQPQDGGEVPGGTAR